ncbi:hypothetical protein NitYY0826_C2045 [Nitratiruptor sp. YY08-26]|uniref:exosortase H-associated membrane protein n=1 Tax=unclassified Nitratiruptor TaxID=2624044 RepID=UPI00191531CF|nr:MULTISPECIES: exosortase H-associated membrane protein [unclassified Nitratiruptor]BCD63151.1 hypothetical protein NitYY0813_C2043 [Nitratiruptor sp. YY08-13]BCD67086.1 hypothetical protein NitYY0826_C2045 [Nitratiruptor sp. YY08-26]
MKRHLLKLFMLFLLLLFPTILGWSYIKNYYNFFVSNTSFGITAKYYDLAIQKTDTKGKEIIFSIKNATPMKDIKGKSHDFTMDLSLDMEAVTFNVPLTLSLLLAIVLAFKIPLKKRWEILYTGVLLLFMLHFFSMLLFSFCTIAPVANINPYVHFYLARHYLAGDALCAIKNFFINYAARFEPFLIGVYGWWEARRSKY